ncbi:MAG: hypothetical protein ACPH9T_10860 [Paracoccaceae bacterium]
MAHPQEAISNAQAGLCKMCQSRGGARRARREPHAVAARDGELLQRHDGERGARRAERARALSPNPTRAEPDPRLLAVPVPRFAPRISPPKAGRIRARTLKVQFHFHPTQ